MSEVELLVWLLTLVRIASTVALLAPFSGGPVPAPVKIGLSAALTLAWAPATAASASPELAAAVAGPQPGWSLGWLAVRETAVGVAMAWVLGLLFVPLRVAGAYIGQEMGLTLGGLSSPVDGQQSSAVTQLLEALGTVAFFTVEGHHLLLATVRRTLDLFPLGGGGPLPGAAWVTQSVAAAERLGLELAAPIGIGLFLMLALSLLVMRSVPQFNLLTFGLPLRLAAGVFLLVALWPDVLARAVSLMRRWPAL